MAIPIIQPSFAAGELSPSLYGRVDYAKEHVGLSTCRNAFVSYRGGVYSRAGTSFCGFSKQTGRTVPPRLITFQFSINQGLALEFGNLYMRVLVNGQFVTEPSTTITGITTANPGVITDNGHGYSVGDWVSFSGIVGMTELNNLTGIIATPTANTYELRNVYGQLIDTSTFGTYVSGGKAARIYTLVTPYAETDLLYLKLTQSADVMSICCWNQITGTSYPSYNLARLADDNWTLTQLDVGASIGAPASCSGNATVIASGSNQPTDYQYAVTAVDKITGEESIASPTADIPNSVDIALTAGSIELTWAGVDGAGYYNVYKAPPAYNSTVPTGSFFGYAGSSFGTKFVDSNIIQDLSQVPPTHSNPFATGKILSVQITVTGFNLTTVTWTVGTATGSGFDGYPVISGETLQAFVVTNPGEGYLPGDTITFNNAGFASGTIDFGATNPSDGDTITLNSVVWTFVSAIAEANQTTIQGTLAETLAALVSGLAASANSLITVANYVASDAVLNIQYGRPGIIGDTYTLAASAATPSGPTLTGGTPGGGFMNPAAILIISEFGSNPSVVSYFQQRRVYAASPNNPDTYWMSKPGQFQNFDSRIPTIDSDAITGTPWSVQVDGIQFLVPMPGGLVVLTGSSAWQVTGAGGSSLNPQPITPAGQQAQPQAYNGCNDHIPPIKIDYDINYVQAKGSVLRDLNYNFFANIYTGTDLTYLSTQLFTGYEILEMAWCEEPYKVIWATRNDGILLSLTYLKAQEVMGWSRHDTNGQFWSVCSVTEPPVDALYLAAQRYIGNHSPYIIERMNNRIWTSAEDAWCVDSALTIDLPTPNANLSASSANGVGRPSSVTGLIGGTGYSSATFGEIDDPTGSGANVVLTISGGVITNVNITSGSGYTYPKLNIIDPNGLGSGASATVVLNTRVTFTADAGVFSLLAVGQILRMGGGKAVITAYNSVTEVVGTMLSPIVNVIPNSGGTPQIAAAGEWSISPNVTAISGLQHLEGATVTGIADGLVIPPTVVSSTGTITLATPASKVTIGLVYGVQIQSLYLDGGSPTEQGRRKKIAAVTARFEDTAVASVQGGSNQPDGSVQSPPQVEMTWANLAPFVLLPNQGLPSYNDTTVPLFTGDVRVPVSGGFQTPGQVAIQQLAPLPVQLLAFIPELLSGDTPEEKYEPEKSSRGRGQ